MPTALGERIVIRRDRLSLAEHLPDGLLSIAVFGPGKGEAIVVKLPDGKLGIVDGCREPEEQDPVDLLLVGEHPAGDRDDIRASQPIDFVCLTHPHHDHYPGQWRILSKYRCIRKVCMSPKGTDYASAYLRLRQVSTVPEPGIPDVEGLQGYERLVSQWRARNEEGRLHTLSQDHLIVDGVFDHERYEVKCCGPAPRDAERALSDALAGGSALDPNVISAALMVRWGAARVLLAGDLLNGGSDQHSGWNALAEELEAPVQVVNVAHHASGPAHHEDLWARLAPRLAIVTPFMNATGSQPPRPEMIAKLAQRAAVAITTPPDWVDQPGVPIRQRRGRSPRSEPRQRNSVLKNLARVSAVPGDASIFNAVAVSLSKAGDIQQVVLAGEADLYHP